MRLLSYLTFLQVAYLCSPVSCRGRGGSNGDNGGGGDGDSSDGSDSVTPGPDLEQLKFSFDPQCRIGSPDQCVCQLYQPRLKLFALPGLYYNGTLTITHRVSDNSAWAKESLDDGLELAFTFTNNSRCPSDDGMEKTYEYPALFHVGPRGNDDDPNPLHWSLKAFQPYDGPYLDILQRWVHIRSSDFFVDRPIRRFDYWDETNANDRTGAYTKTRDENTTAYWKTSLTEGKDGSFSARTTYDHQAPNSTQTTFPAYPMSQYITLSDVCKLGFVSEEEPLDQYSQSGDDEEDEDDKIYRTSVPPTVWIRPGTEASIHGIGDDKLTFELDADWEDPTIPYIGLRRAQCGGSQGDQFQAFEDELSPGSAVALVRPPSSKYIWPSDMFWNLTLSVELKFEGSIVRENSTEIMGFSNDVVQFAKGYDYEEKEKELGYPGTTEDSDDDNGSSALSPADAVLAGMTSFIAGMALLAW